MEPGSPPDSTATRERLKSIAVRLLLCVLLTLVVPGTALLASAVAPDEWLSFQTGLHLIALVSALIGAVATILTFVDGMSQARRIAHRLVSDESERWNSAEPRP